MYSKTLPVALCLAATTFSASAVPAVIQDLTSRTELQNVARSFVGSDLDGVLFTVMSQYRQGTTTGMAPECPQSMKIMEGDDLVTSAGILKIPYDRMKLWGTANDAGSEPNTTCKVTGHKYIELAESQLLRGGEELDELRESFDISDVFDDVTDEEVAAGAITDEVKRLHESVWTALKNKQYFTGKMDYAFGDESPQKELEGITCNALKWFRRGELFLLVDESKDVEIFVKTTAKTTEGVKLVRNRRYAVVTTADSTCIYQVNVDKTADRNSDLDNDGKNEIAEVVVKPPTVCAADCTCQCT